MARHWYLIAYDIRCPRRLQRVQKAVSGEAQRLQQSVYMVRAGRGELRRLLEQFEAEMDPAEDDLRAYPFPHPGQLWCGGTMVAGEPAVAASNDPRWRQWLQRFREELGRLRQGAGDE